MARIYSTSSYTHPDDGCPTKIEFQRDNLGSVSVRIVTGNVCSRWHPLSVLDGRNIIELLQDR